MLTQQLKTFRRFWWKNEREQVVITNILQDEYQQTQTTMGPIQV